MEQRPEVADALPHDSEVIEWRESHAALVARREVLVQRKGMVTASTPPLLEAVKYEGNNGIVAKLEAAQTNLVRRLNGEPIGGSWQGGFTEFYEFCGSRFGGCPPATRGPTSPTDSPAANRRGRFTSSLPRRRVWRKAQASGLPLRQSSYLSANTACPTASWLMLMSTWYVPTPNEDAARL